MDTTDTMNPIEFAEYGPVTVATVRTPLRAGEEATGLAAHQLDELVRGRLGLHLLVNFHHASKVPLEFLAELGALRRILERNGGTLRLCALQEDVRQVLDVFGLDGLYLDPKARHALPKYLAYLERHQRAWPPAFMPALARL